MNEQKKVHITIFQAPFASLIDLGLYMKMHDPKQPFQATVPAEYYLAVFDGEIECPKSLPSDKGRRTYAILEHSMEKEPGHELCIGVYCAESDETVYYNSYHLMDGDEEGNDD